MVEERQSPIASPADAVSDAERLRLAALANLDLLDTPPEREFDTITRAARTLFDCRIALVSLVDADRQWFKSRCGLDVGETPRELAFCSHVVAADAIMVVPDATRDARFADNPLVTGAPHLRFYAGVPIRVAGATPDAPSLSIGTLCVIDDRPRTPDDVDLATLADLAHLVEGLISARALARRAVDLAEQRGEALDQLARAHRQFRQAERIADVGSWRLNLAGDRAEWSDQIYVIHGVPIGDGTPLDAALDYYPPHARPIIEGAIACTIRTGEPFEVETDFQTAQGEYRRVRCMGELEFVDGEAVALIGVFQDITERHLLECTLRRTASTDDLTGIANRPRFNEVFEEAIADAHARRQSCALLLLDLDHFKAVNDCCGHQAGDELLRLFAARLQAPYLADCLPARLGGDEFVLLVTNRAHLADLPGMLRRLLGELRDTVRTADAEVDVSTTIGACWLDEEASTRSEMLRRADAALYRAKRAQRGSAMIAGWDEIILPGQPLSALRFAR